jgi:transcriptional regulator with XRE-family HTH domain
MKENDLRAVLSSNIRKYRTRRGWSQLCLAEKIDLSANFISDLETCKGWVSPLTLVKLAEALEIEVFELFMPNCTERRYESPSNHDKSVRFVKDMTLALEVSSASAAKLFRQTVEKVCRQYDFSVPKP